VSDEIDLRLTPNVGWPSLRSIELQPSRQPGE
jgi:hypothetical protein